MRNILLAGVALMGFSALISEARADSMPPLPSITAAPGKTDGAAPGSVSVNIGLQELTAIMAEGGTGATGNNARAEPQLFNWFHLFPSAEYVNPAGIHFGINAEIRNNNSGKALGSAGGNTLYLHQVNAFVSSDKFGKLAFGTPNGALDDLGVGTGDDFGDGLFYSWYGPPNAPWFAMADSYDGDTPRQKITYETPDFGGIKAGISYQPSDVPLDHSTSLTTGGFGGAAKNRVEVAVQLNKTFGTVGVKADVGGAFSGAEAAAGNKFTQSVAYFNGGAVVTVAGVELEGSVSSGKFSATGGAFGLSPGAPSLAGSKDSTVYIVGLGYNMGPIGIGAVYYGMSYDDADGAGNYAPGKKSDTVSGEGLGASYVVGPGVTLQFDAYTYQTKVPAPGKNTNGSIVALASQFAF